MAQPRPLQGLAACHATPPEKRTGCCAVRNRGVHRRGYESLSEMICITEVSVSVVVSPNSRPSATS